jgi:monoamine oxidase
MRSFASGYDTADPARFSVFAMRRELQSEDDNHQYRVEGGYGVMISYLEDQIIKSGGSIHLSTIVKQLQWEQGKVTAMADDGREFIASGVIVALPLGVLQADKQQRGAITFMPPIPQKEQAIQQMGIGAVVKILLQFDEIFWQRQALKKGAAADVKDMSYLFSEQAIPTWWTQTPDAIPMLTGWIGGPAAMALKNASDDYILQLSLLSLSNIFDIPLADLKPKLKAHQIANWTAEDFTRGSYSYATIATDEARKIICDAEMDTLYFAGEALYDGPEMGTVEAALASGKEVAEILLKNWAG